MVKANLLVTFDPTHTESVKKEISERMQDIKEKAKVIKIEEGLAELSVKDNRKTIKALAKLAKKKDKFNYTKRWIPVDAWTSAKIPDMQKAIKAAVKGLKPKDKWKMDIGKHRNDMSIMELITKLTEVIDNQHVDLEKPDKIVKVELVEKQAGIALLEKDSILNVVK